jgi:hypothetical protein
MPDDRSICVICAWRQTCNKKFSMDGATSTRCLDYTKDVTLTSAEADEPTQDSKRQSG